MSKVNVTTLRDRVSGDETPVLDAIHGSAKAWVNFDGTGTVAIRASYNVSSVTDNGVGDYTVNFTNAMPDANFAAALVANTTAGTQTSRTQSKAATGYELQIVNNGSLADASLIDVAIFR